MKGLYLYLFFYYLLQQYNEHFNQGNYENKVSNKLKDDIYLSELFDCVQQRRNYTKIWYKINNKYFS